MKVVYIILSILVAVVVLFFILNQLYRYNTIDKGLGKKLAKGAIILDVRTDREFNKGHIKEALHMPLGNIEERYTELDSSNTYITYCSHGIRSVEVKKILKEKGFRKVYNGGAWSDLEEVINKMQ